MQDKKLITLFIFILIILITSLLTFSFAVLVLQIFLGSITVAYCIKANFNLKTLKIFMLIFCISMLFVFLVFIANFLHYGSPYYIGGSDDLYFEQCGYDAFRSDIIAPSDIMQYVTYPYNEYTVFVGYVSLLIKISELIDGYTTFLPRIANVYFITWTCMLLRYLLLKYTFMGSAAILYSLCFFALMPNILHINAYVFRDTFNVVQILLATVVFSQIIDKKNYLLKVFFAIVFLLLLYLALYTRSTSILIIILIIILTLLKEYPKRAMFIIFPVLIILIFISNTLSIWEGKLMRYIAAYSEYLLTSAGTGLSSYIFKQPLLPLGIIYRSIYALISPFPDFFNLYKIQSKWLLDSVSLLIYLGAILQITFIPFIAKRTLRFDWLAWVFLGTFVSVIISTFTFRHVLFYYPFLAAIAVDGFLTTEPAKRKYLLFSSIGIVLYFGLVYCAIKFL